MIRRILVFVTVLALGITGFAVEPVKSAEPDTPTKIISSMVDEVFAVLNKGCAQGRSVRSYREELYQVALKYVDLDEVAPRVVGPVWRDQTKEAQEEFKKLFREVVFSSYADRLERYACAQKKVIYENDEIQGSIARVRSRVQSPDQGEAQIEYRLKKKPTGWKIYDVVVEGVSMVQNYRSQFADILRRQSFAQMLDMLRNKVETGKN
ncbi:MAG: ABC transporter substrate-binding protein [Thermodesulforhabdaceae bacterium]